MASYNDIPFVRALRAATFFLAVDRGPEEVSPGIHTRSIDIVVLGVVAHPVCWLSRKDVWNKVRTGTAEKKEMKQPRVRRYYVPEGSLIETGAERCTDFWPLG